MATPEEIPNVTSWILRGYPVGRESLCRLASMLEARSYPKKHVLVSEGTTTGEAYFIEEGMTRSYWVVDGEEITTSFSTEGSIVFSMDEVYYRIPSQEYVETVEPVKAYALSLDNLRDIITRDIDMANWWSVIHQDEYRRLHRSHKERLTLTAAERYRAFAEQHPEVSRRARLADIASYLGITPSTLSHIRAGRR